MLKVGEVYQYTAQSYNVTFIVMSTCECPNNGKGFMVTIIGGSIKSVIGKEMDVFEYSSMCRDSTFLQTEEADLLRLIYG